MEVTVGEMLTIVTIAAAAVAGWIGFIRRLDRVSTNVDRVDEKVARIDKKVDGYGDSLVQSSACQARHETLEKHLKFLGDGQFTLHEALINAKVIVNPPVMPKRPEED